MAKGGSKFAPKAKPRPTRRSRPETQEGSEAGTPTDGNDAHENTSQAGVGRAEIDAQQALQQLRSPQTELQGIEGIPQIVETASNGIPVVGQGATTITAATAITADGIPAVESSPKTSQRLRPPLHASAGAPAGSTRTRALPRMLPNRPPSTSMGSAGSSATLPRLASLSTAISMPGMAAVPETSSVGHERPSSSLIPAPMKRQRTSDSASSRRTTPDLMPLMRLKTIEDYPTLGMDEISRLPIAYFCKDNRHGRPTQEFIERENNTIRKMYEPLTKGKTTENNDEDAQTAAKEKAPDKPQNDASKNDDARPSQPAASSANRMAAQVRIVDGKVVVDSESLVVSRSDMAGAEREPLELVDESARPRFINSLTYVQKRASRKRWTASETDAFYEALRKYGSDFEMISAVMAGRNRYDIRNKFKTEEKKNAERVTDTLLAQRSPPPTPLSASKAASFASKLQQQQQDSDEDAPLPMSFESYSLAATPDNTAALADSD
ncbi:hypothetical protein IWW48_002865 [Coemansia sp. RSA 1200]|nr:hypothetical protein IWW48_002865 [Coemansia sp. RSA 1200]